MKDQPHQDRRSFLKAMGGTTAIVAAVPALFNPPPADAQNANPAAAGGGGGGGGGAAGFASGKFAIELDGKHAGWISSAEGGHAVADVVTEKMGGDHIQRKHIGNVKYEDITITCDPGVGRAVTDWAQSVLNRSSQRKNGAIIAADYNYKELNRLTFFNALITEIGMPALDAASKDAAKMTIKFRPEYTRRMPGSGNALPRPTNDAQKKWLPANFRLEIAGLDCSRVNKIEALTIKQKVTENAVGEQRDYELEPASVEIPNLVVTLAESHSSTFYDWHEDFVIRGNCTEDTEKSGKLTWLENNGRELGTLTFSHLGVFKVAPDKMEAGAEGIRRIKAEMYCEDIRFSFTGPVPQ